MSNAVAIEPSQVSPEIPVIPMVQEPSITIKASDKFAPIVMRLLADLIMCHSNEDPANALELHQLSNRMDTWRSENVEKCAS